MSDKDYDQLFDLVDKLVNEPGPWQEKKKKLLYEAELNAENSWEEFVSWFQES